MKTPWDLLAPQLTDSRRKRLESVSSHRTEHIRLVLQDIHDPHNVAACLRSADAFGVLNVDVVNLSRSTRRSGAQKGTSDWLRLREHQDIDTCVAALRAEGYYLAAGFPNVPHALEDLPVDRKLAVIFGNERNGVDSRWLPHIDQRFTIPMCGMVESLNISVAAALTLYQLTRAAQKQLGAETYYLSEVQCAELRNEWIVRQVRNVETQLQHFRGDPSKS